MRFVYLTIFLLVASIACAQQRTVRYEAGRKKVITATDSTLKRDSLLLVDSLYLADSLTRKRDSLLLDKSHLASTILPKIKTELNRDKRKFNLTQDTISQGRFTLLSLIPGVGQIYNRQYWKVPVFYAAIGGFTAGSLISSNNYSKYKSDWERSVDLRLPQALQDRAKSKMDNEGTVRTVLFSMAVASYLYQLTDAAFNYRGKTDHIRKATTLALTFPGAGFVYTRTYWRLPIYYGGFIVLGSVVDYNNRSYERFAKAYDALTDGDPNTVDEFNGRYSADMLQNARNSYRRNRDFGIICLIGAYLLSVVDTHVIATLKNWDVSPDLSIRVEPTVINNRVHWANNVPTGAGLSLKITF